MEVGIPKVYGHYPLPCLEVGPYSFELSLEIFVQCTEVQDR